MGAGNPTTLVIRGEGGGLTIEDIPTAPARREVFDAYVAKGLYRILGLAPEGAEIDEGGDLVVGRVQHADPEKAKAGKVVDVADLEPYLTGPTDEPAQTAVPSKRASKDAWLEFAVFSLGMDEAAVASLDKADLIKAVEAELAPGDEDDD